MTDTNKMFDVFISHSPADAGLARDIADGLRANGLEAVTNADLLPAANAGDALWEALAESRALLAVLSRSGLTPAMGIELAAVRAWNKPIFGVVTDPTFTDLPLGLTDISLYTPGRIEDVIRAVKASSGELSEDDRGLLSDLYAEIGITVDEFALDPTHLEELVTRFSAETTKTVPGERLLSELLRMRKQGKLTKNRIKVRPKPRRGSA